jgi:hypothetical protein
MRVAKGAVQKFFKGQRRFVVDGPNPHNGSWAEDDKQPSRTRSHPLLGSLGWIGQ